MILFLYLLTSERWAVFGTECRRRGKGRGRRSEQRERGPFRALKMCPVRQEAAFGTAASKDASGGQVLLLARPPLKCVQCGRRLSTVCGVGCSAGLLRCVQCSRMPFLRFRKCIRWSRRLFSAPLKMRRVPEKAVFGTEYPFRTVEVCFWYRISRTDTR